MATTVITDETVSINLRMGAVMDVAVIDDGSAEVVYTLPGSIEQTDAVNTLPAKVYGPYPFGVVFEITATNSVQADTSAVSEFQEAFIEQVESLPTHGKRGVIYQTLNKSYWWNGQEYIEMGGGTGGPGQFTDLYVSNKFVLMEKRTIPLPTDPGEEGEVCWDSGYFYVCIAPNTWTRVELHTWE